MVRIAVYILFSFLFKFFLSGLISSFALLILFFPFFLSFLILFLFFLSPFFSLLLLFFSCLILLFSLIQPSNLIFNPSDVFQIILLIIVIIILSNKLIDIVINSIFKLVSFLFNRFKFNIILSFNLFRSFLHFSLTFCSFSLLF